MYILHPPLYLSLLSLSRLPTLPHLLPLLPQIRQFLLQLLLPELFLEALQSVYHLRLHCLLVLDGTELTQLLNLSLDAHVVHLKTPVPPRLTPVSFEHRVVFMQHVFQLLHRLRLPLLPISPHRTQHRLLLVLAQHRQFKHMALDRQTKIRDGFTSGSA